MYCELFDNLSYDSFLESTEVPLTDVQRSLGILLIQKMNSYADSIDYLADTQKVFEDPEWDDIRRVAKEFLAAH